MSTIAEEFEQLYGPFFTYQEFRCKCDRCSLKSTQKIDSGRWFKTPEFKSFMLVFIELRIECNFPFKINSGYRCPDYNDSLYQSDGRHLDGPHTKGAADVEASFERGYKLNKKASARDMGIGPVQKGPLAKRFLHVDNLGPRLWTY